MPPCPVWIGRLWGKFFALDEEEESHSFLDQLESQTLIGSDLLSGCRIQLWSDTSFVVSEKESLIPEPGSKIMTQLMGEDIDSARQEFMSQDESRVDKDFATATTVVDYLKHTVIDVFVLTRHQRY